MQTNQVVKEASPVPKVEPIRVNLGCGRDLKPGWINIDMFSDDPTVTKMDFRRLELQENYADELFSSHSLEHIPHTETIPVLQNWFFVLKPGGKLVLNVPDMEWCLKKWLSLPEEERSGYYHAAIFGLQNGPGQVHYTSFTHSRIKQLLEQVGFTNIETKDYWIFEQSTIWVEAIKPLNTSNAAGRSGMGNISPSLKDTTDLFSSSEKGQLLSLIEELKGHIKHLETQNEVYQARWNKLKSIPLLGALFVGRDKS